MRIHRVRGKNLEDALERARIQHGEAALVLSQEATDNGDVLLSVSERRKAVNAVFPSASAPAARKLAVANNSALEERGLNDVQARLTRAQISQAGIDRVLNVVRGSKALGPFAIDAAAAELTRMLRIAKSPRAEGRLRALAFVGPTGVGKTTTLAKLAVRLVRAGRRVSLVSTDHLRIGAYEQLAAYAKFLQAPVSVARDANELARIAAESAQFDVLLIDTTGRSPHDAAALEGLGANLDSARSRAQLETYLVLAASASREALQAASNAFAQTRPTAAILTKLDETRAPGPAVEIGSNCGHGLLFLCNGQDVSNHLQRAAAEPCADLILRGRLA
jgi:flagellar biosynthesis GTPase FlhF